MKQFSQERKNLTARACALILAATFTLSPVSAPAQIGEGSLDDMWAEHQDPEKPAATEAPAEKPAKKSRKTKKPKGLQPPQPDGDLLKSTDKPASGWDSASGSSESGAGSGDVEKKEGTATAPTAGSDSATTADSPTTPSSTSSTTTTSDTSSSTSASTSSSKPASRSSSTKTTTTSVTTPAASSAPETPVKTTTSSEGSGDSSSFSTKTETASSSETAIGTTGPMQPLCKLASLQSSDLVKSGGWPGVGPFAQDKSDSAALVDDSKNRLKLKVSGEDVTHAELLLVNQSPKPSQLLAIQMTADFLLEAVGAQPGRIADFNNDMMKNQEKLASASSDGSVNLKAGTYVVQIQKKPAQESTVPGNVSFLIALDNQKPTVVASATPKTTPPTSFSIYSSPSTSTTTTTTPTTSTTPPKTAIATTPPPPTTPPAPKSDDLLHKQFSNLITSWQQVKRAAVRNRQSASLSRILGGKALGTQNRAIEWLIENKRYYDMTPVELKVLNYKEITPSAKYEIETFIKERQQLVSADTMKVEKDTTQAYTVVYTVERIRGAWLITDTRMVAKQQ